jgi:hypothetical protein
MLFLGFLWLPLEKPHRIKQAQRCGRTASSYYMNLTAVVVVIYFYFLSWGSFVLMYPANLALMERMPRCVVAPSGMFCLKFQRLMAAKDFRRLF